jgi:hypothetical protein
MKFNQWTLGLAAIGVVSLASAAKAEEKANLQTALSSTTISGYVDTSAQWNFNVSDGVLPPYKFGGVGKADGFNLDVVQVRIDKALDESEWAAGYRVDLWFGPDANTLNTSSTVGGSGDFAIRQAYVALRTPIGNGLEWKVGVFDSILGYESVESGNNPNYTRSYGHSIEPQTQTGVLTTYRFSDMISASAGVADTALTSSINSRSPNALAWMGSIALTAPEDMGFLAGSTLYAGIENGFGGTTTAPGSTGPENATSYYAGATIATPVTGLRLGTAFDLLDVHHQSGETWTVAGYASFQASEKMSLHLRGEYLKDRGEQQWFALDSEKTMAITGTIQYDLWKNVISRLEVRWDHSLDGVNEFGGTAGNPDVKNAWMLGANVIYKF